LVVLQPRKISHFLWPVKDGLGRGHWEYTIFLVECSEVYIGQTGCFGQLEIEGAPAAYPAIETRQATVVKHSINSLAPVSSTPNPDIWIIPSVRQLS
jgi:hypothetical protein